ncbi:MAG TPA: LLM class flavin-dependent oxidoreductase [Rubrobacteraceae bacterium]|nr:LLM class flavin-dependent oxidoreductase [Rubrobacteraceae bacterium]
MGISVDIRVPVGRPIPEVVDFIVRCEAAGFDGVGVHDHHHSGRDVFVALALAAARTSRLDLYPATSNTVTRHPLVLAALANSLEEVAPERTCLTLAPGFLSVESAGRRKASLEKLREDVYAVRRLLAGEVVPSGGTDVWMRNRPGRPLPVLLTASGPRLLELAGEVADGALMLVGLDPQAISAARRHLRAGAERAGRDPAELREVFIVPIAVGEREAVREWPRRWFRPGQPWLEYPSRSNLRWLEEAGIEVAEGRDPESIPEELADRICDAFGLFGEPEHCAERLIRAHEEAGVDHVFLFPAHTSETGYEMPQAEVEAFERVIGPRLRQ